MDQGEIRKGRKYDQVLEGARRVFLRDGFDGASVDDIAREAGVSKATLYSYFPDKRLLFTEICNQESRRQTELAETELDISAPVEAQLAFAAERIVAFMISDLGRNMCRLMMSEAGKFPDLAQQFYCNGPALLHGRLVHHMRHLVALGGLQIGDLDLAADQFAQLCKGPLHERMIFGLPNPSPEEQARIIRGAVEMFMARYGAHAA